MFRLICRPYRAKAASLLVVAAMLAGPTTGAFAQENVAEQRLRKVESEVKALQRKVFPGGDDRFFQPEITSPGATTTAAPAQASTSAVTDLLSRMSAVETQLARLTGEIEMNTNRLNVLEQRIGIGVPAGTTAAAAATTATAASTALTSSTPVATSSVTPTTVSQAVAKPVTPATPPSSARLAGVQAIEKPETGDAGDDEYSYGFRLWEAKYYPEARQQLQIFVDKYPKHRRISWGRNLLGRAYMDDGNPREAAKWFLQNYQADKSGGRAPDSLLYLARAMKDMKDTKRACIALAEFSETYAAEAAGRLKNDFTTTQRGLTCSA